MALNTLEDSFSHSQKNVGMKGLKHQKLSSCQWEVNKNTDIFPDDDRLKYLQLGQRNDGASLRPVPDGLLLSRVVVVASGRV